MRSAKSAPDRFDAAIGDLDATDAEPLGVGHQQKGGPIEQQTAGAAEVGPPVPIENRIDAAPRLDSIDGGPFAGFVSRVSHI